MNNIIYLTGVPTPKYRAQRVRQDRDQDLFVDLLARHPAHIARAKAKAEAYAKEKAREAEEEAAREAEREKLLSVVGHVAFFALLALMVVVAL